MKLQTSFIHRAKRLLTLLFALHLLTAVHDSACSQSHEVGVFLGVATYKGELQQSLFEYGQSRPALGLLVRHNLNSHWSQRLAFNYGTLFASDSESNDPYNIQRNLSFRSRVLDLHYVFEFNFLPYQIANPQTFFAPFIYAGLNVYKFNPQAELNNQWYDLQPLGTEGQGTAEYSDRKKYKRIQLGIPFGGGFKFKLSKRFGVTIEAGARRLYTDYLDDVSTTYVDKTVLANENGSLAAVLSDRSLDGQSLDNTNRQRGNASDNDWYMFTGFSLNYTLSKKYTDNCKPFKGKLR